MATYVLVHGGWHGGWCWQRVMPLLRAAGHEAHAPTLTGLGERSHLLTREIGLDTHVQDIVNVLVYEDLYDVVLVGHSYAGMVVAGVAERTPERLARLVYLDAFVPWEGQSVLDLMGSQASTVRERSVREGDGWGVPPLPLELFGVTDADDLAWAGARIGMQPIATFEQPIPQSSPLAAALPRTYIHCTAWDGFTPDADRARTEPGWGVHELATGHDAMLTAPDDLASLLLNLA